MIVGLCGAAGSGKDTVADFMVKNHGFVKIAFADPLKRICKEVFDFSDEQLWGPSEMRNAPDDRYPRGFIDAGHMLTEEALKEFPDGKVPQYLTPRYALQQLGTEWGRGCYENVWIGYAMRVANEVLKSPLYTYSQRAGLLDLKKYPLGSGYSSVVKGVVISDVRFQNEIDAIHKASGKVVRLVRPRLGLTGAASMHASESEQRDIPDEVFDHHLINKAHDLALLEACVAGLVETILL